MHEVEPDRDASDATDRDRENDNDFLETEPAKRKKSHRPSLEVVEVKIESFYDKDEFKQDMQVGN